MHGLVGETPCVLMVLFSALWYCMVLYGAVWFCVVLCGAMWCSDCSREAQIGCVGTIV